MAVTTDQKGSKTFKFIQKYPYEFLFVWSEGSNSVFIEFSGKALLDSYPELISKDNIWDCFFNINQIGVCRFNIPETIADATVNHCDVTCDIKSDIKVSDLYSNIILSNYQDYAIGFCDKRKKTRFSIQSTNVTTRRKVELVVYDKEVEMKCNGSKSFFSHVSNENEQKEYFKGIIRIELHLRSIDRIRWYFKIKHNHEISLTEILNSTESPIESFLNKAVRPYSSTPDLIKAFGSIKEIKDLLFLALFGFDMQTIEKFVRSQNGPKVSIKNKMEPYKRIFEKITPILNDPQKSFTLMTLGNNMVFTLDTLLNDNPVINPEVNLITFYKKSLQSQDNGYLF